MSLKNIDKKENNTVELSVAIAKADFDAQVMRVYRKNVSKISVPGFRKGKAPKSVIERMYGKGVFYEEALDAILPGLLRDAVNESGIESVGEPTIDMADNAFEQDEIIIKALYPVFPSAELASYKGLEVEKIVRTVSDAEVENVVSQDIKKHSRIITVSDRPAAMDDTVKIDYEGSVDGVAFDGGKAENHSLKLGSGSFIPGFEEQIVGHSIGDSFDVNVTFPEKYHAEELAGKAAVFACKLNAIEYEELPELDDEFVKDISDFDTVDEYKADIKANIEKRYAENSRMEVESKLVEKIVEGMTSDIPEAMFANEVNALAEEYASNFARQGISFDLYLKYTGMTADQFKEQFKPQAERNVKARVALRAVAALEGITASEDEIKEKYESLATIYKTTAEELKAYVNEKLVINDIVNEKALKVVTDSAVITEKAYEDVVAAHDHEHCDDENCSCHDHEHKDEE